MATRKYDRNKDKETITYYGKIRKSTEKAEEKNKLKKVKAKAHSAVNKAIKEGKLVRQPCEVCGTTKKRVLAHHPSYEEKDFLSVEWLCDVHHQERHRVLPINQKPLLSLESFTV